MKPMQRSKGGDHSSPIKLADKMCRLKVRSMRRWILEESNSKNTAYQVKNEVGQPMLKSVNGM